jgi:hypothetical protein
MTAAIPGGGLASAQRHRLAVVGCVGGAGGLRPAGHHLRWFVPRSLGFPVGFDIWRVGAAESTGMAEKLTRVVDLGGPTPPNLAQVGLGHWSAREHRLGVHELLTLAVRTSPPSCNPTPPDWTSPGVVGTSWRTSGNRCWP